MPALPSAGESISYTHRDQVFDGARIEVIEFRAGSLRFLTDSLAPWILVADLPAGEPVRLRHRLASDATVEIRLVDRDRAPLGDRSWKDFVAAAVNDEQRLPSLLVDGASGTDPDTPSILGMRTRQLALLYPATLERPARVERHLLAADDRIALTFVLRASPETHARAFEDLVFFISRLERR